MYWYIVLDNKELPEPYGSYSQVCEAMEKLRERLGPCCLDCVLK